MALIIVAVLLSTATVGTFSILFNEMDNESGRSSFEDKLDDIRRFMKAKHLPTRLQEAVLQYQEYEWESTNGADERTVCG
jgi:hypothetical protein